ncbi:MAG: DUF2878 domain-containing protein [Lysobacterales bacterium]
MTRTLVNFVAFQVGWFACVISAARGMAWAGVLVVGLVIFLHLLLAARPGQESRLIVLALIMGMVFDSLLVQSAWLQYAGGAALAGMAPYWILAMWALFATTLNVSMGWLKNRSALAVLMGAVFGPLSYLAGERLGAIQFIDYNMAILALTLIWAMAMPLLMFAATRFDGVRKQHTVLPLQGVSRGLMR